MPPLQCRAPFSCCVSVWSQQRLADEDVVSHTRSHVIQEMRALRSAHDAAVQQVLDLEEEKYVTGRALSHPACEYSC